MGIKYKDGIVLGIEDACALAPYGRCVDKMNHASAGRPEAEGSGDVPQTKRAAEPPQSQKKKEKLRLFLLFL